MEREEDRGVQDATPRDDSDLAGPEFYQQSTGSGLSRAGPSSTILDTSIIYQPQPTQRATPNAQR